MDAHEGESSDGNSGEDVDAGGVRIDIEFRGRSLARCSSRRCRDL